MYLDQLEEVLTFSVPKGKIAGFFAEAIQVGSWLFKNYDWSFKGVQFHKNNAITNTL